MLLVGRNILRFSILALCFFTFFIPNSAWAFQFSDTEIREMLTKVANTHSKSLPNILDSETTLEGISAGYERNLIYRYKLNSITRNSEGFSHFKKLVSRKHKNNYCTTPKLSFYRKEGVGIDHNFYSYSGSFLFSVKTNTRDC